MPHPILFISTQISSGTQQPICTKPIPPDISHPHAIARARAVAPPFRTGDHSSTFTRATTRLAALPGLDTSRCLLPAYLPACLLLHCACGGQVGRQGCCYCSCIPALNTPATLSCPAHPRKHGLQCGTAAAAFPPCCKQQNRPGQPTHAHCLHPSSTVQSWQKHSGWTAATPSLLLGLRAAAGGERH